MASFEDYDEFGNYIGADLDSDDEEAPPQRDFAEPPFQQYQEVNEPLEGFAEDVPSTALMEVDGMRSLDLSRTCEY